MDQGHETGKTRETRPATPRIPESREAYRVGARELWIKSRSIGKSTILQRESSASGEEPERQYLTVPYAEREEAKAAGAKWDWREKLWYVGPEGTRRRPS